MFAAMLIVVSGLRGLLTFGFGEGIGLARVEQPKPNRLRPVVYGWLTAAAGAFAASVHSGLPAGVVGNGCAVLNERLFARPGCVLPTAA